MSAVIQSRMLPLLRSSARRRSRLPPSPNRRSKIDAGIGFGGQRRRRRRPGQVVLIRAREAVIAVADLGDQVGAELQRWKCRVLADVLGGDLIDRRAEVVVAAFGSLRLRAAEERAVGRRMVAGGIRVPQLEVGEHRDLIQERHQRRQRGRQIGDPAFALRRPLQPCSRPSGCRRSPGGAPDWRPSGPSRTSPAPSHPATAAPTRRPCHAGTFAGATLSSR